MEAGACEDEAEEKVRLSCGWPVTQLIDWSRAVASLSTMLVPLDGNTAFELTADS